ncbi:MAG: sulfatase [Tannerella sp.]|jgi:arylsulfatase A-like enzyme|nr:sulfatase [Tannerella sp.]
MNSKIIKYLALSPAVFGSLSCNRQQPAQRPNIIFILTDDQRWDALGYAGNKDIQTPAIDKLAQEGVYFRNAFVTTPISAASRASILTGLYERTHGYTFETGNLPKEYMDLSYPVLLRKNGYKTAFYGKLGVNYEQAESLFDDAEIYDRSGRTGYYSKTVDGDTVHLTPYTGYLARNFISAASIDQPFCLSISFSAPHAHDPAPEQYFWGEEAGLLYRDIVIAPPKLGEDKFFESLPEEVRKGYNRVRWGWRYDTPEKYQHSMKGYYRMISEVDNEIAKIRELLEEKGLADNTVIIFMGDNGFFLGERQLAGKWLMYDNSLRVPMLIYDPGNKRHKDIHEPALNIDMAPTILDLADVPSPDIYQGKSLRGYYAPDKTAPERKTILFEHLWKLPQIPSSEGVRTEKWKYFRYRFIDAPEELYDLENDPLETVNLAPDTTYRDILFELREECDRQIQQYRDARIIPGIKND